MFVDLDFFLHLTDLSFQTILMSHRKTTKNKHTTITDKTVMGIWAFFHNRVGSVKWWKKNKQCENFSKFEERRYLFHTPNPKIYSTSRITMYMHIVIVQSTRKWMNCTTYGQEQNMSRKMTLNEYSLINLHNEIFSSWGEREPTLCYQLFPNVHSWKVYYMVILWLYRISREDM